jgi:hypothetical protein
MKVERVAFLLLGRVVDLHFQMLMKAVGLTILHFPLVGTRASPLKSV